MPHPVDSNSQPNTGLHCLLILARFFGVAVDGGQLQHQLSGAAAPFGETELLKGAKLLGLKAKAIQSCWERLAQTPLPAIAQHPDGHYYVLAKVQGDKVLIQDPLEQRPLALPRELFTQAWTGRLILFTRRAGTAQEARSFNFSWFIPSIIKYRALFAEVLVASFFLQLFALATPLFFQVIIDKVLMHKGLTTLDVLAFGFLVVIFFETLLGGLRSYLFSHTSHRIDVALGAKLFDHLLKLPLSYFEARRTGDTVARVRELEGIRQFITGSALTVVIDLTFTVVFLAVMYYYSPLLTFIVLGSLPCYALLSILITPLLRARLNEKFNRGAENQAFLVESVSGVETLKAMAVEPHMQQRWERQLADYVSASFRTQTLGTIAGQVSSFISKLTMVATLWWGAHLVIAGDLTVGMLIAFNMLSGRVSAPVLRLSQLWQDFQQAGISVARLGDILNTPTEPSYSPGRTALPHVKGDITLDHVSFRYQPEGASVLHDVSLAINAGETIGIVGRSGSGKSTLAKLIQRLFIPESGRVLIDGVDLAMVDAAWLRRQIGVVLQESTLFNGSVRDNIALAEPSLSTEIVIQAAKLAGAHDFILKMPHGYDALIGERGSNLSGGQRQRIAIARALVTKPRLLIFDEATSALDYESERLIQANMKAIAKGRTVLIIAHRLSTVRHADRIVVIEEGRIAEQGTHEELLRLGTRYARLHAHQAAGL